MKFLEKPIFLFICFVLIMNSPIYGQTSTKYKYPLDPEMSEWKTLSVKEKKFMLQIPDDKLKEMSTSTLIQAYVDNPFCSLIFAYNTVQDGFKRVYSEFNGLRELLKREDAAIKLIEYYKNLNPSGYEVNWESAKKGEFTFKFIFIEALFSQPEIIQQLNINNMKSLINELNKKYNEKLINVSEHSIVGLSYSVYAIAHILNAKNLFVDGLKSDESIQSLLLTGKINSENTLNKIIHQARIVGKN